MTYWHARNVLRSFSCFNHICPHSKFRVDINEVAPSAIAQKYEAVWGEILQEFAATILVSPV